MSEPDTLAPESAAPEVVPEAVPEAEKIIRDLRATLIPGSPIAQDAACLAHLDFTFIPALIAALKKGV
jgi:hypothetical protein